MAGKHTKYVAVMKAFGKAVRFYRNKLGFSQESLADRAQLDRSYMSQIERGIKNATLNSIWRISLALQVRPSALLALTEEIDAAGDDAGAMLTDRLGGKTREGNGKQAPGYILVVDDDQDICAAVDAMLASAGYTTRNANCGFDAIRILAAKEPVLAVVSDIRMPNGNGLELLDSLRKHNPSVPLFFITGYDDVTAEDAIRRGAVGLFNKPFDMGDFVTTIKSSLGASGLN